MTAEYTAHQTAQENARGVAALLISQSIFVASDVFVRLAAEHQLPVSQIMALRGVMAVGLVISFGLASRSLRHPRFALQPLVLLRAFLEGLIAVTFIIALPNLGMGEIAVLLQATPLMLTALSAVVLREAVGWRRWTATVIGFGGVVLVARPDAAGFNAYALLAVTCAFLIAVRDIVTRRIDKATPTLSVTLATTSMVGLMGFAGAPLEVWRPVDGYALACLAASAVAVSLGNFLIVRAFRGGELSFIAPFRYVVVVWAMAAGYLVWREVPDVFDIAGAAIIVGCGLYMMHRQRVRLRRVDPGVPTV